MQLKQSQIPISLYIHLPWCVRKCPYCDFNSHALRNDLPEEAYIDALIKDLRDNLALLQNRKIESIFFGGGTPSLFSGVGIRRILREISLRCELKDNIEITLEANPGTIDETKFIDFRSAGINRLSLGIQSFQNDKLKILGRIHDGQQAQSAVEVAKRAGFSNFNLDLMHGLPNQTVNDALYDLQTALSFEPTHLSWYQLTLEPNTLFHAQPPKLPDEKIMADIVDAGKQVLSKHNFNHYEVSAFCRDTCYSQHNLNYWQFGDYLGIGAGAHSKITDFENQRIERHSQVKHPRDYMALTSFTGLKKTVGEKDVIFEFMLNALRLIGGFHRSMFECRTGLSFDRIVGQLIPLKMKKLITLNDECVAPTEMGKRFLDDLVGRFLV